MIGLVFVDTNVLVYERDASDPAKRRRAQEWIASLWRDGSGRVSAQVLAEYYVTLTRKLRPPVPPGEAWRLVQALSAWDPLPVDAELLSLAHDIEQRHRLAWWDAMIVAAAQLQGCELLLSEDFSDGTRFGIVTVRSPFTLSAEEAAAAYVPVPRVRGPHPPRGRPPRIRVPAP